MNKLKLKHKIFNECYLGKYKIHNVISSTSVELDIVLEEPNEHIFYQFEFFYDGIYKDEIIINRWYNKLYSNTPERLDVEVTREIVGDDVFDSVRNLATFIFKNGFIKDGVYW